MSMEQVIYCSESVPEWKRQFVKELQEIREEPEAVIVVTLDEKANCHALGWSSDFPRDAVVAAGHLMDMAQKQVRFLGYLDEDMLFRLSTALKRLPAAQRWIPVSKQHPFNEYGEGKSVLTVDTLGVMRIAEYVGGVWQTPDGEPITNTKAFPITHWRELPEPPEEEP